MNYFFNCTRREEAKTLYHKLAKKFHPDLGGTNEKMIELQRQYDAWQASQNENNKATRDDIFNNFSSFSDSPYNMYNKYNFNKIKRAAPFDHALQEEINNLTNRLERNEKTIMELMELKKYYCNQIDSLFNSNALLKKELNEANDLIEELEEQIKHLKQPKSLWQYLTGKS